MSTKTRSDETGRSGRRPAAQQIPRAGLGSCGARSRRRVGHHLLQNGDVLEESSSAVASQSAERLWLSFLGAFPDVDQSGVLKHLQVPVEIAVGERAKRF